MTEMMTEKTSESKGDIRMITLTEKDADSVISLLKEMQSYRQRDIRTAAEKPVSFGGFNKCKPPLFFDREDKNGGLCLSPCFHWKAGRRKPKTGH